jgi:hypothetical protein
MTKNKDIYNVTHHVLKPEPVLDTKAEDIYADSFYDALAKSQIQYEKRFIPDSIVQKIQLEINNRAEMGFKKYNNTLDRTDLSVIDYLQHAKEEAMDLALYLEKTIQMLQGKK